MIKKIIILVEQPLYEQAVKHKGNRTWAQWLDEVTKE